MRRWRSRGHEKDAAPISRGSFITRSFGPDVALDFLAANRYAFDIQMMTRLFLVTVFLLHSSPVCAGWVAVEKPYQPTGLETVYFDPETIQRSGTRATLWQLTDLKWNSTTRFLSTKTHKEFDCEHSRVRVLQVIEFSGQMGTGRSKPGYIENGSWQPVEERTVTHALWSAACGTR